MMIDLLGIVAALGAYGLGSYVCEKVTFSVCLNVSQAAVDASKCSMAFDQVSCDECPTDFDLPFIEVSKCADWWYEIWLWDFIGRQLVMEHAAANMQVMWPEFDDSEF